MALRAAAVASIARRHRNASPLSLSRRNFLGSKVHGLPPCSIPRNLLFTSPLHQAGLKHPIRAIQGATADPAARKKDIEEEESPQNWKIKMLYDGGCPLCMREVNMLRERNRQYGTIKFVDIGSDNYSPEENQGLDYETAMGRIHAILSDGTVVTDVEAFRRLYEEVGLGWIYAITKYKPIATLADAVYGVWAKYRLQITGRPPLEEILEARKKNQSELCNDSNKCKV